MSKHHKPGRRPAFGQAGTGPDYVVDSSPTAEREPSTETEPRNDEDLKAAAKAPAKPALIPAEPVKEAPNVER